MQTIAKSVFTFTSSVADTEDPSEGGPDESISEAKSFYMVDAGLAVNLPIPPLLRPQRQVDLLLSFDFSARDSDDDFPFKASVGICSIAFSSAK